MKKLNDLLNEKTKLEKQILSLQSEIEFFQFPDEKEIDEKISQLENLESETLIRFHTHKATQSDLNKIRDEIATLKTEKPTAETLKVFKAQNMAMERLQNEISELNQDIDKFNLIEFHQDLTKLITELEKKFNETLPIFKAIDEVYKKSLALDGNSTGLNKSLISLKNQNLGLLEKPIKDALHTVPNNPNKFDNMRNILAVGESKILKSMD